MGTVQMSRLCSLLRVRSARFRILLRALLLWPALCLAGDGLADADVVSVKQVELTRYLGKWYEIAHFPMYFQRNCIGDTTAEYALSATGDVVVFNRCRTASGFDEAHGNAALVNGAGNAKLQVSFFWPFRADYWVIGLDPDYRWTVVANPSRKYLWILSRTPALAPELLDSALAAAAAQGFDLDKLQYTRHGPAVQGQQ